MNNHQKQIRRACCFGYLAHAVDEREWILVRAGSKYEYPVIRMVSEGEAVENTVDMAVKEVVQAAFKKADHFFEAGFSTPEIMKIQPFTGQRVSLSEGCGTGADQELSEIDLYFFKVGLTSRIEPVDERYAWIPKTKFLPREAPRAQDMLQLETAPRLDKISYELGKRVLECVDVLVFREDVPGQPQFLILRRKPKSEDALSEKWEYPKGGIEYHETVHEGAVRELLEETGILSTGSFRFGGKLGMQTVDIGWRNHPRYDTLRVHGVTYLFYGSDEDIHKLIDGQQKDYEHDAHQWVSLEEARRLVKIGDYADRFFEKWWEKRWKIGQRVSKPISVAFQVTEECPIDCSFCLRRQASEQDLSLDERREIIDILGTRGVLRLTLTGGEPMVNSKKEDTISLLEYAHAKRIHTCLSTTAIGIGAADMDRLALCLDQMLLSVHACDPELAPVLYDHPKIFAKLLQKAGEVLNWAAIGGIIVEISTVVSRVNRDHLPQLGEWLFGQNRNLFWRLEEYYANGSQAALGRAAAFELDEGEFERLTNPLLEKFGANRVHRSAKRSRLVAPDIMITPAGKIVTSSGMKYTVVGDKHDLLYLELKNRRRWKEYRDCVRTDWNW